MNSHTVPRRLLEQFAYEDSRTKSLRPWRYRKSFAPRGDAAPKAASRIPGYFKHSQDLERESKLETALNAEIESPVHEMLPRLATGELSFEREIRSKLARYMVLLFSRSQARRQAMAVTQRLRHGLLRESLACPICMQTLATKWNLERYDLGSPLNWLITPQMVKEALKPKLIEATTKSDQQNSFSGWIDHVLRHRDGDTALVLGRWTLLRTNEDDPYLISDSPLISFSRGKAGLISWGDGFNKPTVEVILPISPTACLHVVPAQNKVDYVLPTTEEVNWLQALFVHESGYCNKYSQRLEELVGAYAETAQIGINCYVVNPESYRYYFLETMLKCSSKKAISPLARPLNLFFRATARA